MVSLQNEKEMKKFFRDVLFKDEKIILLFKTGSVYLQLTVGQSSPKVNNLPNYC